jgi:hypothetical protein
MQALVASSIICYDLQCLHSTKAMLQQRADADAQRAADRAADAAGGSGSARGAPVPGLASASASPPGAARSRRADAFLRQVLAFGGDHGAVTTWLMGLLNEVDSARPGVHNFVKVCVCLRVRAGERKGNG